MEKKTAKQILEAEVGPIQDEDVIHFLVELRRAKKKNNLSNFQKIISEKLKEIGVS
jgi:hypothetical protein